MLKLIRNELKKLSKKKSVYITLGIFIGLLVFLNVITSIDIDKSVADYEVSDENVNYLTSEIQSLNPNNPDDLDSYIELKSQLDYIDFLKEYDNNSWQRNVIVEEGRNIIYEIVDQKYRTKNDEALASAEAKLEDMKSKLENDDWRSFVKEKKLLYESELANLETSIISITDKNAREEMQKDIETKKIMLYSLDYRLDNDVSYAESYLNTAIFEYENSRIEKLSYNTENMSKAEEQEYNNLLEIEALNKYSLDNKVDLRAYSNAHNAFASVIGDNLIFFAIFIIMIAGAIVSEEFNKGTIKMLLVRPYQRWKILASKYLTCLIMLVIGIVVIIGGQFVIGGIVYGFDSYNIPAIVYDFSQNSIIEISMLKYHLLNLGAVLPYLLLLMTLAFTISTVFTSTSLAITLTFLTMFFSEMINVLIINNSVKVLKFFPTMCWDLSSFLFGRTPLFEYTSLKLCITMDIIYLVLMLFISFFIFKRKNVKNI